MTHKVDALTVAALCQAAAGRFVREARNGGNAREFHIDLLRRVQVPDKSIVLLGRRHAVAIRIRITCESLLFEGDDAASFSAVLPPADAWRG